MARPLTERTANAARLDAALPDEIVAALQRLIDTRNSEQRNQGGARVYARDIHEEAVREMLARVEAGQRIRFLAPTFGRGPRRTFWIDASLKTAIDQLAESAQVTRTAVILTALHDFLEARKLLNAA
ncbi:MAG: hypothetical protein JOY71_02805 [Acetobacteraceae bacterium]|nr:hypothetical protein [Acetobacteraceae bacterium]MBV8521056.1 hypothetical protein [Acetobacteraceae bacterium]